jgi:hypothetical protein
MIVSYLQGGIGNQMFQYAAGLALAKKFDTSLHLNTSSFLHDPMREYSLHLWAGVTEKVDSSSPSGEIVREEGLPYNPEVVKKFSRDCGIWGYWQTEKYFADIAGSLMWRFVPRQPLTARGEETLKDIRQAGERSVFLTIRRTDYTQSDFHGVLPLSYYEEALQIIARQVDPEIFVFSDDPEWCEENLRFPYKTVIAGNYDRTVKGHIGREDEELWLMRHCRHAIMANSSYSWWGAWLGADKTGGIVIAPQQWFYKANEDPSDICPPRWTKI